MTADRAALSRLLVEHFKAIPSVVSATLVGSFAVATNPHHASDVDVVIICEALTRDVFDRCLATASELTGAKLGKPGARVVINSTFGPMKIGTPETVVLHLMIYDIAGHREHVLASPFTCYDWERSDVVAGLHLTDVYPVLALQPRDFLEARRGLEDYLADLRSGCLSVRRYAWSEHGQPQQVVDRVPVSGYEAGQYAYHVIRHVLLNHAKLCEGKNVSRTDDDLLGFAARELPEVAFVLDGFAELGRAKRGETSWPAGALALAERFVSTFVNRKTETQAVTWMRHATTEMNDGTFLGQRRDPPADVSTMQIVDTAVVFSSPARRAQETAHAVSPSAVLRIDERLVEVDYGEAEGMTLAELAARYPAVVDAWKRGDDPAFPGGENLASVRARLRSFMASLPAGEDVLVVTHNVVLRELTGELYGVRPADRFRIPVSHAEVFETVRLGGRLHPNLTRQQKATITDAIVQK